MLMLKLAIGIGLSILALGGFSQVRVVENAGKLPKCSNQICKPDCSPDVLCARGASVVTCAEVCGGH